MYIATKMTVKLFILIFFIISIANINAIENRIIVKLDNIIITTIDIENESNYLKALNPEIKKLNIEKLNSISKNSLIREKIKEKEILTYIEKIELKKEYLNQLIRQRYSRLKLKNKSDFLNYIKQYNIDIETIERKISIEALWNQLIYQKFSKNIKIDIKKLEDQINKKDKENQRNLLLSEIVFKASNKKDLNKRYNEILNQINKEGFESAALTHSISDSSSIGGKLGWIKQSSLNKTISEKLLNLKQGEITKPIFTSNGYLILKLDELKYIENKIDKKKELNELIKLKRNEQLNQKSIIYFNKVKKNIKIYEN